MNNASRPCQTLIQSCDSSQTIAAPAVVQDEPFLQLPFVSQS